MLKPKKRPKERTKERPKDQNRTSYNLLLAKSLNMLREKRFVNGTLTSLSGISSFPARMLLICSGLWLYLRSHQPKFGDILTIFVVWPPIFVNTKEFLKNTKENLRSDNICSHFLQEVPIDLIPPSECCIFITLSIDTHIGHIWCHMAIWSYGYMAIFWPYGHLAIWLYGIECGQYGCLRKQQYKCSILTKELR